MNAISKIQFRCFQDNLINDVLFEKGYRLDLFNNLEAFVETKQTYMTISELDHLLVLCEYGRHCDYVCYSQKWFCLEEKAINCFKKNKKKKWKALIIEEDFLSVRWKECLRKV